MSKHDISINSFASCYLSGVLIILMVARALPVMAGTLPAATGTLPAAAQPPAQHSQVSGLITDAETHHGIPFAHVALFDSTGCNLLGGTTSDIEGQFQLNVPTDGLHLLKISALGYSQVVLSLDEKTGPGSIWALGEILLPVGITNMDEIIITGRQVAARTQAGKTSYYVNHAMAETARTGTEILRHIPGIHIDLFQNITLEGNSQILLLVDGMERDAGYLQQLHAKNISHVEISKVPASSHDGDLGGMIQIFLNDNRKTGTAGHVNLEIPTARTQVYLSPSYRFQYGSGRYNLFTSYNGQINYFNLLETSQRYMSEAERTGDAPLHSASQYIRQQFHSHRFHYGSDYFVSDRHQINFYGSINPLLQNLIGEMPLQASSLTLYEQSEFHARTSMAQGSSSYKNERERNLQVIHSLFYRYLPQGHPSHEITADINMGWLRSENRSLFSDRSLGVDELFISKPGRQTLSAKLEYRRPLGDHLYLESGVSKRRRVLTNSSDPLFRYDEDLLAIHASFRYHRFNHLLEFGTRVEDMEYFLPQGVIKMQRTPSQTVQFHYRSSVTRPWWGHLIPRPSFLDPLTISYGNPGLRPERHHYAAFELTRILGNSFIAAEVYHRRTGDAAGRTGELLDNQLVKTQMKQLGRLHEYGFRLSASVNIRDRVTVNPYARYYLVSSLGNATAKSLGLKNRSCSSADMGLSAAAMLSESFSAAFQIQYAGPVTHFFEQTYSSALYFISLNKSFGAGFQAGLVTGLPLARSFVYDGSEFRGSGFHNHHKGMIQMSAVPVWFTLNYRFSSGESRKRIEREREEMENPIRKPGLRI